LRYPSGFTLEARFEAGQGVTALFGPSGSGKSTTLGLISGTLRPEQGSIRLAGRTLVETGQRLFMPPERRRVGVVFQDHLLFPHLTVQDNLRFGQRRRHGRPMSLERVAQVLEIGDLLTRRPNSLSGGQRQRVALGRALLRGPELLLMDEPLAAVEEALKDRILTYLERAVAEWHIPTVFVSHDQADVRRLAERVVVIEAGRVLAAGPTPEALEQAVLGGLRGVPGPVSLLEVKELRRVEAHWEGRVGEQRLHLPPGDYVAGGAALVQVAPQEVMLGSSQVAGLSARNQLRGSVREVLGLRDQVFVAVDIGQFLWAQVTPEAAQELELRPGKEVTCLVKTSALLVLR